ncbi:MAG: hypothetical protein ACTSUP_07870 [Candidatus Heimdallarchaeaceae archaeon]
MGNLVDKFKNLRKNIASLSEKKARIEGKKEQKLLELKEKYGIITMEEAEEKLGELAEKIETQENQLQKLLKELEEIVELAEGKV